MANRDGVIKRRGVDGKRNSVWLLERIVPKLTGTVARLPFYLDFMLPMYGASTAYMLLHAGLCHVRPMGAHCINFVKLT